VCALLLLFPAGESRGASPDAAPLAEVPPPPGASKERQPIVDLTVGFNYIYPTAHLSIAPLEHFALGIMPFYVIPHTVGTGQIRNGGGGAVTVSYYGDGPFQGLWLVGGGGVLAQSYSGPGTTQWISSPTAFAAFGWRWYWKSGLNFGFAAGANLLFKAPAQPEIFNYSALQPTLVIDLGFAF
jgi:hypothetical protein